MNKFRFTIKVLVIATFVFAFASMAQAQATRTWVSGVGDDANPCSRTAPCKTFAGAISKTAPHGEINVLDPGGFGAVTITKAITIDGSGGSIAGVLVSGTNAIVINAGASDTVSLRNLDIDGLTTGLTGIKILGATKTVFVENCQVYGFTARGLSDERTTSGSLFVENCIFRDTSASQSGVVVIPGGGATVNATFDNCRFQNNGGAGLATEGNTVVTVSNSIATGNGNGGFVSEAAASAVLNLQNCISSHNATGLRVSNSATMRISNCQITNNTTLGLDQAGGTIVSFGNNSIDGNAGVSPSNGPPNGSKAQQ